ncbi:hypothetical protein MCOR25_008813 [Pyricularia grisea]|uniref:endo-1,3(4)-beta-glucanase n=1 Tax=Pyricularia grisea TaxID=148305 RepID=A0A6P8BIL6_PYRGI|nr:uncharacterized protein PgNI_02395 [Pyricularia grisea]KAI6353992.1 hypothetical protein MCOR25_008813 [Pyricularia grisea]TLD16467.1 hypothetical protein PgNI_02395 [Pyricularia grisea]
MSVRATVSSELFDDYIRRTREQHGYTPFEYWVPPKTLPARALRKFNSKEFLNRSSESQRRVASRQPGVHRRSQPRPKTAQRRQMHEMREARMQRQRRQRLQRLEQQQLEREQQIELEEPQQQQQQKDLRPKNSSADSSSRDSAVVLDPVEETASYEPVWQEWPSSVPPTYQDVVRIRRGADMAPIPASVMDEKRLLAAAAESVRIVDEHPALRGSGANSFEEHPALRGGGSEGIVSDGTHNAARGSWFRRDHPASDEESTKKGFRGWSRRTTALVVALAVIGLVIVIVVPVVITTEQHKNRYPDYFKINYTLTETYSGENFFDKFSYYSGDDPTHGFVKYVTREEAKIYNLTSTSSTSAILRVDNTSSPYTFPDVAEGRMSVRVESKRQYDRGLFIFDVKHTPFGCGTWPALWLAGLTRWPRDGEIDVMEAVNRATDGNLQSLHTSGGCSMEGVRRIMTGAAAKADCYSGGEDNTGCNVRGDGNDTFGSGFNKAGGGLLAVELRDEGIRTWQFTRAKVPADVEVGTPDPSGWGPAMADFPSTECNIGEHFRNQSIILNISLCGDWGDKAYAGSGCPMNCSDFVATNPSAFTDAFWEFGAFRVYEPIKK